MRSRTLLASVLSLVIIAGSAIAGAYAVQGDVEQRISGLEARVSLLEQEVASLKADGIEATPASETYTIEGTVQLRQDRDEPVIYLDALGHCSGTRGYDDIQTGANVVILDGSGTTLATTTLETADDSDGSRPRSNICEFQFTVEVPAADFYTLEIGRRGAPTYSFAEMEDNDWRMDLSIGR